MDFTPQTRKHKIGVIFRNHSPQRRKTPFFESGEPKTHFLVQTRQNHYFGAWDLDLEPGTWNLSAKTTFLETETLRGVLSHAPARGNILGDLYSGRDLKKEPKNRGRARK
jgi:hypothetical protein